MRRQTIGGISSSSARAAFEEQFSKPGLDFSMGFANSSSVGLPTLQEEGEEPVPMVDTPRPTNKRKFVAEADDPMSSKSPAGSGKRAAISSQAVPPAAGEALRDRANTLFSPDIRKKVKTLTRSVSARALISRRRSMSRKTKTSRSYFGSPRKNTQTSSSWVESLGGEAETVTAVMAKDDIARQEVLYELTTGEAQYAKDLDHMERVFQKPMSELGVITKLETKAIFSNLPTLAKIHTELSDKFEKARVDHKVDCVGDILLAWVPKLEAYKEYCANQPYAKHVLDGRRSAHDPKLDNFLQTTQDMALTRRMDLWSFLDVPRRRLQRYPLLIERLVKYTPAEHADHAPLTAALDKFKSIIQDVNNFVAQNSRAKIVEVQNSLEFAHSSHRVDLIEDNQPLQLEAEAQLKDGKDIYMHLFPHLLLLSKDSKHKSDKRCLITRPLRLEHIMIDDTSSLNSKWRSSIRGRDKETTNGSAEEIEPMAGGWSPPFTTVLFN